MRPGDGSDLTKPDYMMNDGDCPRKGRCRCSKDMKNRQGKEGEKSSSASVLPTTLWLDLVHARVLHSGASVLLLPL